MIPRYTGVVAMDGNRAIGADNGIPWKLPEDMKLFKEITMGHPILMGRRTWESLGRPLPGRQNIVLTRTPGYQAPGATVIQTLEELQETDLQHPEIMVIGGAQIYALMLPHMQQLYVSEVKGTHAADTYFPPFARLFPYRKELKRFDTFTLALYSKAPADTGSLPS